MVYLRGIDRGLSAPKTGRVVPADVGQKLWRCFCYKCHDKQFGDTRREVIIKHLGHVEECRG